MVQFPEEKPEVQDCMSRRSWLQRWITKEKLMKIVVSLGNTHYGNYVKMIAEQYSGNG